ncbi:hypothetical protein AB0J71_17025 [Nonomuraea sp. NPDC049637]|uniref:hypothetical protein n=1 Tax=Nonomuraea sp. NPDC049637 TaxID=3154356 RepID=UPI003448039F
MTADSRTGNSRRTGYVLVVILVLLACLAEGVHLFGGRAERMREVYGGAFQVAHPEYDVIVGHEVGVGPLSMGVTVSSFETRPSLRGRPAHEEIVTDVLGRTSAPAMPEAMMSPLLRSFHGGEGVDEPAKSQARQAIAALGKNDFSTAVVELTAPMTENELTTALDVQGIRLDAVFLFLSRSRGDADKPVYWRSCAVYETECQNTSPIELYRRWAAKLEWTDALNLKSFGLDLRRLRQAAHEGRIYGLVVYGHSKPALTELIGKPGVRTIEIVGSSRIGS